MHHGHDSSENAEALRKAFGLGATKRFPEGKLNKTDEGEIKLAVGVEQGKVILAFGTPVAWLGLDAAQADSLADSLHAKAGEVRGAPAQTIAQKLEPATKRLIATVGLPRSGKTTWARSQGVPIVNPDSIRLALHGERFIDRAEPFVWATAKLMVRALFEAGHATVILDATNTTRKRRDEWKSGEWSLVFMHIPTSREVCMRRAEEKNDAEILPVIGRMAEQFEPLGSDESRM